jgi:hypothetical protein
LPAKATSRKPTTDYLDNIGHAYVALADVLAVAGRPTDAAQALNHAAMLFERKGDVVSAAPAREQIAVLQARSVTPLARLPLSVEGG